MINTPRPVRLEFLRKGAFLLQTTRKRSSGTGRPAGVRRWCSSLLRGSGTAGRLHLVAEDRALDPAVAAGGAGPALPRSARHGDRVDRYHRAAAALVFLAAAAGTGIVSAGSHRKSLAHALDLAHKPHVVSFVILLSVLASIAHRGSKVLVSLAALHLGANSFMVGVLAALYAVFPLLLAVYAAGSPTALACATRSFSARSASPRASPFRRCTKAWSRCFCVRP